MAYVRSLAFEEAPDYKYSRQLFKSLADRLGVQYDGKFDWIVQDDKQREESVFCNTNRMTIIQER